MLHSIKVSSLDHSLTWTKQLTDSEAQTIANSIYTRGPVNALGATLLPVRTNNLKNFVKDFFLPNTLRESFKTQNIARKIFAVLASLILDVVTFPIRLITCIPRIIYNSRQPTHPLYSYLVKERVDKHLLALDSVRARLESNSPTVRIWHEENVNFIEPPAYANQDYYDVGVYP